MSIRLLASHTIPRVIGKEIDKPDNYEEFIVFLYDVFSDVENWNKMVTKVKHTIFKTRIYVRLG